MKPYRALILVLAAVVCLMGGPVFGQNAFTDANVDYTFSLPDPQWKMTAKPSATSPNVEYVYNDRLEGHLEVRKLTVAKDALLTDIIRNEETKLQFRPGYIAGKEENFAGRLKGSTFNFEFVAAGRSMAGRFYFLRASDTVVYLLRFTGQKDTIRSIRAQTDSIARTFAVGK